MSSDHETYTPSSTFPSSSNDEIHNFAPPLTFPRKKFTGSKELKPLIILNENISKSTRFYNLFSVPLHLYHLSLSSLNPCPVSLCPCMFREYADIRHPSIHMFHPPKQLVSKNVSVTSSAPPNSYPKPHIPHYTLPQPLQTPHQLHDLRVKAMTTSTYSRERDP